MDHMIETFSCLWHAKFPEAELPDTSFFKSKEIVEEEIKKRTEKINRLKVELRKEEFFLNYLCEAKSKSLWTFVDQENNIVNTDQNISPNLIYNVGVNTENLDLSTTDLDKDLIEQVDNFSPQPDLEHSDGRGRLLTGKLSTSLDSGTESKSLSLTSKSFSVDSTNTQSYNDDESNTSSSDDDSHEYMNAEEYSKKPLPKLPSPSPPTTSPPPPTTSPPPPTPPTPQMPPTPLPKAPQTKETAFECDFQHKESDEDADDADDYMNIHMQPKLQKLKMSSDDEKENIQIQKNDDQNIYSVPTGISKGNSKRKVKRLGSSDRKGSAFSDDMVVQDNSGLPPFTFSNSMQESTVDEHVETTTTTPSITIDKNVSYYDDEHIYANIKDICIPKTKSEGSEEDSDEGGLHSHEVQSPHYREMTPGEIEKFYCCTEDDCPGYDSDDGGSHNSTPDILRKKLRAESSNEISRSQSAEQLSKYRVSDEKVKASHVHEHQHEEDNKKVMSGRNRKYLAMNLLDTEKCYNDCLDILGKYMKPLRISTESSKPILSAVDFEAIFHRADKLVSLHKEFMCSLEPLVQDWNEKMLIGEAFKPIMHNFDLYSSYISNYKHAMETVLKCRNANAQFKDIMNQDIRIPSLKEPLKLDGLLYKPIDRMTQYSLLLNDLLKHTPPEHPDHPIIVEISSELFNLFEQVNVDSSKKNNRQQRTFLKETAVVELVDGERRARNLILFNDVIISAKLKPSGDSYICKWYAALKDLSLKPYPNSEEKSSVPVCKVECDKIRANLANLKQELRKELPVVQQIAAGDAAYPFIKRHTGRQHGVRASSRAIERLKKKIDEQEQLLQLISPIIPIYVYLITGKTYALLVGTEADRLAWVEALKPRIKKASVRSDGPVQLSSLELQQAFETVIKMQTLQSRHGSDGVKMAKNEKLFLNVQSAGRPISMDLASLDEYKELLSGYLFVKVNNAKGFNKHSDTYIVLETCSYGHFFKKGKTKQARGSDPQWDEEFNVEIEACQYLRITCYNKLRLIGDDVSGKVNIDLPREGLSDNQVHSITVSMDKGVVTMNLSLSFSTTSDGLIKQSSKSQEGVFSVPIKIVCKRECSDIPAVVISCIKEVEKRGMDEVGIYRLSGMAKSIRDLKKLFDEDTQMAVLTLSDVDVHAVAGLLKLYFRDLPESLFTYKLYNKFVNGLSITDPEEKELYMADVLHEMPRVNLMTTLYLFHHLRRVVVLEPTNKMGINNLATVFGPTVLRPPPSGDGSDSCNIGSFDIGALDVMSQVGVFRYILALQNNERTKLPEDDLELWRRLDNEKAMQIEMGTTQEFLI